MLKKTFFAVLMMTLFLQAANAIESSDLENDAAKRSKGCDLAYKISAGQKTPGEMTADETISYNYLRASYPEEFARCSVKKSLPAPVSMTSRAEDYPFEGKVSHILDGRSFALVSGQKFTMLGIRIPEEKKAEAVDFLQQTLQGKVVAIRYDRERKDRFNRLQGYAYLGNDFVNKMLIEKGVAIFESMPPNISRDAVLNPPPSPAAASAEQIISEEDAYLEQIQKQRSRTIYLVWGSVAAALIVGFALKKLMSR